MTTKTPAAPERPKFAPPPRRGPAGGPFGGMGMPAEKSLNFVPSAKRLLGRMKSERIGLVFVVLLGVISVVFSVPRRLVKPADGTNGASSPPVIG